MMRAWLGVLLCFGGGAALAEAPQARQPVAIKEWPVPWQGSRPRDPYPAPDGKVWFVGQAGDYLAWFDPKTEKFGKHDLGEGVGPHNCIVDGEGRVWYAGNRDAHIGRFDPASEKMTQYPMPALTARDPHTLIFDGRDGIWFSVQLGNFIGRLSMPTGEVRLIKVPKAIARPYGIVSDTTGRPWAALLGTHRLATVDPVSFKLELIELPRAGSRPRRIGLTADGRVWYVDYAQGYLGSYDPRRRDISEWKTPSKDAGPYAMAVDDRDRVWFVETIPQPNLLVGFDPRNESFFSVTPIPSGAGAVRHMIFEPKGRHLWFGTDKDTLGRATLPD